MYLLPRDSASSNNAQQQNAQNDRWLREWLNVCIAMIVLDTVFVALRVIARRTSKSRWYWDDWLIIPAWISNAISLCLNFYIIHWDSKALDPQANETDATIALSNAIRAIYAWEIVFVTAYTFPKLSILFLYLRIFSDKYLRWITWSLIIFMIADCIAFFIPAILLCNPPSTFWDFSSSGSCLNLNAYNRAVPFPNIFTDLIMLTIPLPTVIKLQAPLSRRLGIALTFLTGSAGLVVAIVRWAFFLKYSIHSASLGVTSKLDILAIVESSTYLLAACMPPMRSLIQHSVYGTVSTSLSEIFQRTRYGSSSSASRLRPGPAGAIDQTRQHNILGNTNATADERGQSMEYAGWEKEVPDIAIVRSSSTL